jgi:steroid delta-isomerase-like uncharacterized protein
VSIEANKAIIRRYYEELWNQWRFELADELIDQDVRFRGSLGRMVAGRGGLVGYMKHVQAGFPDFFNTIEEVIAEDDRVVARLSFTGTHRGEMFGMPPTGHRVRYAGVGIFQVSGSRVIEGWVLGDLAGLLLQLRPDDK